MKEVLIAVVPSLVAGLSAYLLYRSGDNAQKRQAQSEKERLDREQARDTQRAEAEGRGAAMAAKRDRYEACLQGLHEFHAFLAHAEAVAAKRLGQPVDPVPQDLLGRFTAGMSGALLEAPDDLADLITRVQDGLLEDMQLQRDSGLGFAALKLNADDIMEMRRLMRADLAGLDG